MTNRLTDVYALGQSPYEKSAATLDVSQKHHVQSLKGKAVIAVYDGPADLLAHYETSVFVR